MKKKTPLKQMDSGLVNAYTDAMMSEVPRGDAMGKGMDAIMEQAGSVVDKVWKDKNAARDKEKERVRLAKEKGDKVAQATLDMGGSLGKSTFDSCYPAVESIQAEYDEAVKNNDKKGMAMAMQKLNEFSATTGSLKELNSDVALAKKENDLSANCKPGGREDTILTSFLDDSTKKRVSANDDGMQMFEYEVEIDGEKEWVTHDDVNNILENNRTDHESIADVRDLIIQAGDSADDENRAGKEFNDYDEVRTTSKMNTIIKKGKLNSLLYDDVLENGEPFVDAIYENPEIKGMTYESLGLMEKDIVAKVDTNNDGIIQDNEAQTLLELGHKDMIVDALINPDNANFDEERTRGVMANYFSTAVKQQYSKNKSKNKQKVGNYPVSGGAMYQENSDGSKSPVSPAGDRFKNMTTEELLAMYPTN